MTQMDTSYPEFDEPHYEEERTTSRLAITSLVCSLILCCPATTIIGPLLGLIAIVRISNNPARKGTGLALAAIIIGVLATAGWAWFGLWSYKNFAVPVQEGPREAMRAAFDGEPARFRAEMFGDAAAASDEQIEAFALDLQSRYGDFITIEFDEAAMQPPTFEQMMDPVQVYPYRFVFENATVAAEVELASVDPRSQRFFGRTKFGSITIRDEEHGNLHFPPEE